MLRTKKLLMEAQFHGARRLAERRYRLCWALALGFFSWATSSIIITTINRFLQSPTFLTKLDGGNTYEPFPTVSICPEVNFPDYKIDAFLESLKYPPEISASQLKPIIRQLAAYYSPDVSYSVESLTTIETLLDLNNIEVGEATRRLTLNCEELLLRCTAFGLWKNCSELFELELTKFGYCCIYNGRSVKNRSVGGQYTKLPTHYLLSRHHSLSIVINASQEQTDIDLTYNWMYLQSGQSYIECAVNGTPIAPNSEVWVGFSTTHFRIDEDIRQLSSQLHVCRPSSDKLTHIPQYSKIHCLLECEIEQTLKKCNCSRLTHPRPPDVPCCSATSLDCAKDATVWFESKVCDCPPTCDLTHDGFISHIVPLMPGNFVSNHFYDGLDFSKVSIVRAFILPRGYKYLSRRAYFTSEHLFSQLGGEINLFFGCSILTILEILQLVWFCLKDYRNKRTLTQSTDLKQQTLSKKKKTKISAAVKTVVDKGNKVELKK